MMKNIENETMNFLPILALEIGLNESIALQQLYMRLQTSNTVMDGKRWFQHTYVEWQEIFPFWSVSTIKKIFSSLQKKGIIIVEQHGKRRYDRTNWYTICEDTLQDFAPTEKQKC